MKESKVHNIPLIEERIKEKLSREKYSERFMHFRIYSSWVSKSKDIRLSYRRFLQLAWILKESPSSLLLEKTSQEEIEKFLVVCDSNEKITKFIKISKAFMKALFIEQKLKKTTLLENIYDDRLDVSRKTITRVLEKDGYLEFSLRTFLTILEGLKIDYDDFFKKIFEVICNETNN